MFKPVKATNYKEYFDMLPPERKEPMKQVARFIRKCAPSLKPVFVYNMPGFGTFKYKNYKGETLDWPVVGLASQKNYMSLYVCALDGNEYIAEKYKDKLGKGLPAGRRVSVGKSCIRFKKVEDLNLATLKKMIKFAAKNPGLVNAQKKK
jgi:uncharacterized protein YdhG (YjbR/CyaY superfamily)